MTIDTLFHILIGTHGCNEPDAKVIYDPIIFHSKVRNDDHEDAV